MTNRDLVDGIVKEIVDFGGLTYERLYRFPRQPAPEIDFFRSLNEKQKERFLMILREVQIDTAASILGFLDGDFWIEDQEEDLVLLYGDDKTPLNGTLADILLETVGRSKSPPIGG